MCGICGFISRKCITIDQLKKMNDTMYHRGPNDSGEEIFQEWLLSRICTETSLHYGSVHVGASANVF